MYMNSMNLSIIWHMGRLLLNTLNSVIRRELFVILLNVLETPQTLSLLDIVNDVNFPAFIGR